MEGRKAPAAVSTPTRSPCCGLPIYALASRSPPFPTREPEAGEASPSRLLASITTIPQGCHALQFPKSFDIWILWRGRPAGAHTTGGETKAREWEGLLGDLGAGRVQAGEGSTASPTPVPALSRSSQQEGASSPPLPPPQSSFQRGPTPQPPRRWPPGQIPLAMALVCHRLGSPGKRSFRKKLQRL